MEIISSDYRLMARKTFLRFLRFIAIKLGINRFFWKIHALVKEASTDAASATVSIRAATFTDQFGVIHQLDRHHRETLKPNWRREFEPPSAVTLTKREAKKTIDSWISRLNGIQCYLRSFEPDIDITSRDVLEVGTGDGATAYALASMGANTVLGIDIISSEKLPYRLGLRQTYASVIDHSLASRVSFNEGDICNSTIPSNSVDLIVSWEVLEHIVSPEEAFKEMARILRPGGLAFHDYNPFFSINGGHSLCTLDFPWGHARLAPNDFEKYYDVLRPEQKELSMNMYENGLNRMTMSDIGRILPNGLRLVHILPMIRRHMLHRVTSDILDQVQTIYPTVTCEDLAATDIWVVQKKA